MNTLKVSQVNTYIKALIDASEPLGSIYVEGEISNFKHYQPSGHMYFTLKDDKSQLKAVIFASSAYRLRFRPENGMSVICRGRITVYEKAENISFMQKICSPLASERLILLLNSLKKSCLKRGYVTLL